MLLVDLLEEYVIYAQAAGRSAHTITSMRYHVRRFELFLKEKEYSDTCDRVGPRVVREFVTEYRERYAPKTMANNIVALKTLFNFGVEEGIVSSNPVLRIEVPKVPNEGKDVLSVSEVEWMLRICDRNTLLGQRNFAIILTLFDSGIRASELVGLRDDDVDWGLRLLTVMGKGSKERPVPVSSRTIRAIRRYVRRRDNRHQSVERLFVNQDGEPLTPSGLRQIVKNAGDRVGLHAYPHKLRHSYAVEALRNGAREFDIQACLGHTTLEMTRHYARQAGTDLAEAHRSFSPATRLKVRV